MGIQTIGIKTIGIHKPKAGLGINWAAYWAAHLFDESNVNYRAGIRSGLTIAENSGNYIKLLPVCYRGNGATHYIQSRNLLASDDWVFYFDIILSGTITNGIIISNGWPLQIIVQPTNSRWVFNIGDGTNLRQFLIPIATLPITAREYNFKVTHDRDGNTVVYEGVANLGTRTGTFTNCVGYTYFGADDVGGGDIGNSCFIKQVKIYSDLAETTLKAHYIFTGGSIEFDLSGNKYDLTTTDYNVTARSFSVSGSSYLLDNGWGLWQKSGSADLYMPYGGDFTAVIAAGFVLKAQYATKATGLNMAPCLVGFNETSSAAAVLEIFDRSNTTRQEDISRSSGYYDSTSLATKCRYHISEIFPYETFRSLFKATYKDIIFIKVSKELTDFSLIDFIGYPAQLTGNDILKVKRFCNSDGLLNVGSAYALRIPSYALSFSYDDYTITVGQGTYLDYLDLTVKKVNFTGLGTGAIINNMIQTSDPETLDVATNCNFKNMIFVKAGLAGSSVPIINISACNPIFTNCKLFYSWIFGAAIPMTIANASNVVWNGGNIDCWNKADYYNDVTIGDTSIFTFTGTKFKARLYTKDTAQAIITADELWTTMTGKNGGLKAEDDSIVKITINTRERTFDQQTGLEVATYSISCYNLFDNATLELSGNQLTGQTGISGDGNVGLLKNIISTIGQIWLYISNLLPNAIGTFDNCKIIHTAYTAAGSHIYESDGDNILNIINGSILEFLQNGVNDGQPIESRNLYVKNSEIIHNPIIAGGYRTAIRNAQLLDIEDSVITVQNSIITNAYNIQAEKQTGKPLRLRFSNVTFNNDTVNGNGGFAVNIDLPAAIEVTDYIIVDGIVNNTQEADICSNMATWNTLISQAP